MRRLMTPSHVMQLTPEAQRISSVVIAWMMLENDISIGLIMPSSTTTSWKTMNTCGKIFIPLPSVADPDEENLLTTKDFARTLQRCSGIHG